MIEETLEEYQRTLIEYAIYKFDVKLRVLSDADSCQL